jgi:hypothetical protein
MHFDPGVSDDELRKLRMFTNFLKQLQSFFARDVA